MQLLNVIGFSTSPDHIWVERNTFNAALRPKSGTRNHEFVDILGQECHTYSKKERHTKNKPHLNFELLCFILLLQGSLICPLGVRLFYQGQQTYSISTRHTHSLEWVGSRKSVRYIDDNVCESKIICTLTKLGTRHRSSLVGSRHGKVQHFSRIEITDWGEYFILEAPVRAELR